MINPAIRVLSSVSQLWCLQIMAHPSPVLKRTAGTAHLHLPRRAFAKYARNNKLQPRPWRVFPTERRCVTTFITPGTRVGLSDRKHSLIQVSGVWVKESSLSVYVHQRHRCCQCTRQHVDSSAGQFPSDLSTHERKYDLQLSSRKASV